MPYCVTLPYDTLVLNMRDMSGTRGRGLPIARDCDLEGPESNISTMYTNYKALRFEDFARRVRRKLKDRGGVHDICGQ